MVVNIHLSNSTLMNCIIEEITLTPPPPPESSRKNDRSDRRLTACYIKDNNEYEIDCFYSPCRTRCHFSNDELGEAIFDHETATFLASTNYLEDQYLIFLTRLTKQWKKQFPDF